MGGKGIRDPLAQSWICGLFKNRRSKENRAVLEDVGSRPANEEDFMGESSHPFRSPSKQGRPEGEGEQMGVKVRGGLGCDDTWP